MIQASRSQDHLESWKRPPGWFGRVPIFRGLVRVTANQSTTDVGRPSKLEQDVRMRRKREAKQQTCLRLYASMALRRTR